MASQEFLASFGVEIDEAGVTRLQTILPEYRRVPVPAGGGGLLAPARAVGRHLYPGRSAGYHGADPGEKGK